MATSQTNLNACYRVKHLRQWIFDQKRVFQRFHSPHTRLIWVTVTSSFPETQIAPQRSSFWNCWRHPKDGDRPAEGTSTWRLAALLPVVAATSRAVCGFPKELLWREQCSFVVQLLIKYFIAPVSLLLDAPQFPWVQLKVSHVKSMILSCIQKSVATPFAGTCSPVAFTSSFAACLPSVISTIEEMSSEHQTVARSLCYCPLI